MKDRENMSDLELLREAFIDAQLIEVEETLRGIPEYKPSRRHMRRVKKILRGEIPPKRGSASVRTRIAVAIVAAALLVLTGCTAYIGREALGEFAVAVYDGYIRLSYEGAENAPASIEEEKALTYLPRGYTSVAKNTQHYFVKNEYFDGDGHFLFFEQHVLSYMIYDFSPEYGRLLSLEVEGFDVYCVVYGDIYICLWNDGEYSYELTLSEPLTLNEIKQIISGIYGE